MNNISDILDLIYKEANPKCDYKKWLELCEIIYNHININNNNIVISRSEIDCLLFYREHNNTFYNIEIDKDFDITFSIIPNNRKLMDNFPIFFYDYDNILDIKEFSIKITEMFNINIEEND